MDKSKGKIEEVSTPKYGARIGSFIDIKTINEQLQTHYFICSNIKQKVEINTT